MAGGSVLLLSETAFLPNDFWKDTERTFTFRVSSATFSPVRLHFPHWGEGMVSPLVLEFTRQYWGGGSQPGPRINLYKNTSIRADDIWD